MSNAELKERLKRLDYEMDEVIERFVNERDSIVPEAIETYLFYIAHLAIERKLLVDSLIQDGSDQSPCSSKQ